MHQALKRSPVLALLGPRQCGKTTLAQHFDGVKPVHYFDLENPRDLEAFRQPQSLLEGLRGLAVLDEIQRLPQVLPLLRVLADRKPLPCRFLLLGSAAPELMRGVSESLAGRVHLLEMAGFSLQELGGQGQERLWLRGGFPRSFLATTDLASLEWRENFIRTYVERDIPLLQTRVPPVTLRRFWSMLAHYHGQTWNASEIGASLSVSHPTAKHYLDLLSGAYLVRQLPPYHVNLSKRVVKSPKVYVRDSGLLHALLGIRSRRDLLSHPKLGASWKGFALEEVLRLSGERHAFFWATHNQAELDLLVQQGGKNWGFEFKVSDAPVMRPSMRIASKDLSLEHLWVIYPGSRRYRMDSKIEAMPLAQLGDLAKIFKR